MTRPSRLAEIDAAYGRALFRYADRFDGLAANERRAVGVYRNLGWHQLVPTSLRLASRCERLADEHRIDAGSRITKSDA